ncbi:helix-turn-helix transcriptional regulator [Paenibacillus hamazuiensis]|uniref:helix-turn-helix transcriptional regulator n=1 Tax=Paenibacillus hamazuiensis TaxID=2936508 RepID=UPI00200D2053|nr:helix-turn-helix transcriptional regulator [Paenibacillus hamazuiensis]
MTSQDVILGILMNQSSAGYDIKRLLETVFSYFYNASFGTIYPMLAKMEQQGLITKESIIQEGKPNKHVYTITEEGRRQFREYLNSELQPEEIKSDFMVRLYFGGLADREHVSEWLSKAIDKTTRTLQSLEDIYGRLKDKKSATQIICVRLGIESCKARLKVLNEGLNDIKALDGELEKE